MGIQNAIYQGEPGASEVKGLYNFILKVLQSRRLAVDFTTKRMDYGTEQCSETAKLIALRMTGMLTLSLLIITVIVSRSPQVRIGRFYKPVAAQMDYRTAAGRGASQSDVGARPVSTWLRPIAKRRLAAKHHSV